MKHNKRNNVAHDDINENVYQFLEYDDITKQQQQLIQEIIKEDQEEIDEQKIKELKKYRKTYVAAITIIVLIFVLFISLTVFYFLSTFLFK
ncbi:hypothetical protein [Mycoplasma hafezii]|uniref:hypothetical protein n=1 Tax=Mycoplasma hafezii TaxID=525886 RepID=UPI003CE7AA04